MIYNVFNYIYLSTIHNLKCKNKKQHLNKGLADTDTRKGNSQHAKLFLSEIRNHKNIQSCFNVRATFAIYTFL